MAFISVLCLSFYLEQDLPDVGHQDHVGNQKVSYFGADQNGLPIWIGGFEEILIYSNMVHVEPDIVDPRGKVLDRSEDSLGNPLTGKF